MGRAAPDLPDPLENQDGAAAGGADDLLSQLAGDEIDRLLAEADVEAAPPVQADAAATAAAADPVADAVLSQPEPALAEAVVGAPTEPSLDAQLNDLFNALNEPVAAAPNADASPEDVPAEPAAARVAPAVALDLDEQLAKLANELLPAPAAEQALAQVDGPMATVPAATAARQEAQVASERAALLEESAEPALGGEDVVYDDADAAVPWYVRPLVWINAPFASLSDGGRDRVGKVALATLLFSITVLAYLAVTRHKL